MNMNIRKVFRILCTLALSVAFIGCGDDDEQGVGDEPDVGAPDAAPDDAEAPEDAAPDQRQVSFEVQVTNVDEPQPVLKSGVFQSPGGPDNGPALFPGEFASFTFDAPPNTIPDSGMRLNIVTMFVQSNDLFYAFPPGGIRLYDDQGQAITGEVTDQIVLFDAGTEVDQEPGVGDNQKPRQGPMAMDVGPSEGETVQPISEAPTNEFEYPQPSEVIKVTLKHDGATQFTVNIENVSTSQTLQTSEGPKAVPLSPGVFVVHTHRPPFKLFEVGQPASPGIESIAEDGFPGGPLPPDSGGLAVSLAEKTGLIIPLSPPAFVLHSDDFQVFSVGQPANRGVQLIAEDGFPGGPLPPSSGGLVEMVSGEPGVKQVGALAAPGGKVPALEPAKGMMGESVRFSVTASPGDRLSILTMFVQSNDFFYAFDERGLALFDDDGNPISGEVTDQIFLYDAGSEIDEEPGVGPTQKPRQPPMATDFGPDEGGVIVPVVEPGESGGKNDGFVYPDNESVIQVTITPQNQDQ